MAGQGFYPLPGLQIGEYIGPPKGINGLLGIADKKKPVALFTVAAMEKNAAENAPLHIVGVLKFIHKGYPVSIADFSDSVRPPSPTRKSATRVSMS